MNSARRWCGRGRGRSKPGGGRLVTALAAAAGGKAERRIVNLAGQALPAFASAGRPASFAT